MKNERRSSRSSSRVSGSGVEKVAELEVPAVAVKSEDDRTKGCCARFDWERGVGIFSIEEPNRRALDVRQTFAPDPLLPVAFFRVLCLGLSVSTMTLDIMGYPDENLWIYCGFLSQWALILAVVYQLSSLLCSMWRGFVDQPPKGLYRPGFMVKITWLFFAVALNLELFTAILYWAFLFNGSSITFEALMKHGGIFVALLLDGFVIGKIPIRIHHLIAVWIVGCLYLIWMGINEALGIGNGTWLNENPEDETNDDALYGMVRWKEDPYFSFFVCIIVIFAVVPALFLMLWMMSFASAGFKFNGAGYRLYNYPAESESKSKSKSDNRTAATGLDTYLDEDHTVVTGRLTQCDDTTCMWTENTPDYVPLDDDRDESFYTAL